MTGGDVVREEFDFVSDSTRCAAWLFRPASDSTTKVPVVVMAHGFAGERSFGLSKYAKIFAQRGMSVLLFDYRHFGDSGGEPRNLVDHRRQHHDWLAAIAHAKSMDGIDAGRIGLWGSSFSGGHVISVAANNPDISAIVAQAPMVDMVRALRINARFAAAAFTHALLDVARSALAQSPHYIPVVAPPGSFAAMNQPGCDAGYRELVPAQSDWSNRCTARSLLTSLSFRASRKAASVTCPALIVIAEKDQVIRAREIERAAGKMPHAEQIRYPVDHFQIYQGDVFKDASQRQAEFFARHLLAT